MKINNYNTSYNQNKRGKNHMICCDREKSFGNIYHSFLYEKVLEKQGIEVTSLNIIKDLCDKHIDNIPLNGK
jgi:hypothetical protein